MMKKMIWFLLPLMILLVSCNGAGGSSGSSLSTGTSSELASSAKSSSNPASSQTSTTNSVDPTREYLQTDPSHGAAYNAAITAYNRFLQGKDETFNINNMTTAEGHIGINGFALFDLNGDGVPELLTICQGYNVFSYQDGKMVHWYSNNLLHGGPITFLENGALFVKQGVTGYSYITFGQNGTMSTVSFGYPNTEDEPYLFNNQEVSKEDWDNLTKRYFDLAKRPASIEWHDYTGN